ncbi:D-glycero-beta-D-manno-heptose 1,7-bisphosphate 7-phosphatase [Sulfurimonas sp. HSL3-2]|uniref:D-glycero-beta-D-manno-heptose 1,7-bisphosphate 7-phosphatase n=1 Tax=Hydrocurvibacter mobilis TaxID=3131936 RepID=UPI0031F9D046
MANKALFLDRDGVINKEINYLHKIEDFEFIEGIFDLCRYFQEKGYLIIVVTNQSGIARGYYSHEQFDILTSWMTAEFAKNNIIVDKVYYCPHHPDISGVCECRKPDIGMFIEAQKEFDIDLKNSIMVGDNERDIEAALKAGVESTYFFDEYNEVTDSKAVKIVHKLEEIYR